MIRRVGRGLVLPALCLALVPAVHAGPVSHFPRHGVGAFLAGHFDLASIRSSFGPRRIPEQRTFMDMGLQPTMATDDLLRFDMPGKWFYEIKIVRRGDVNSDGIEDLEVCFTDRARNGGSYHSAQGLVITRYAADGYALALSFDPGIDPCAPAGQP